MASVRPALNRIVIIVVVIGYVFVNISMQIDFFANRDIFAKYHPAANASEALAVAREAYYAKTGFLLLLLILQTCRVSFALAFALSFAAYAAMMLVFFGITLPTMLYLSGAIALSISYFVSGRR